MDRKRLNYSREKALLALETSLKTGRFLDDLLKPTPGEKESDFAFAKLLAYGARSRAITLDFIASKYASRGIEKLSIREKALLRLAIYESAFLEGIPRHATLFEMVELAKQKCNSGFAKFLNALLRKITPYEPCGDLSIDYGMPPALVDKLAAEYSRPELLQILESVNQLPRTLARIRPGLEFSEVSDFAKVTKDPHFYIQNKTPAHLFSALVEKIEGCPQNILDLCASPGGKLLLAHDFFPNAALFACEKNPKRLPKLQENILKYGLAVDLKTAAGEAYPIPNIPFDLVIADVPCSNTGVIAKRPEARFHALAPTDLQKKLLDHSLLLGKWVLYMTCSLLKEENEEQTAPYMPIIETKILPDLTGNEGGYGALIRSPHF